MKGFTKGPKVTIAVAEKLHSAVSGHSLPNDVLDQSISRLGAIGLVVAISLAATFPLHLMFYHQEARTISALTVSARLVPMFLSLAMFFISRSREISRDLKAKLGLAYEVVGAASIGVLERTLLSDFDLPIGTVSSVVMWIFTVRLLVPTTTLRASIGSGLSALTVLLVFRGAGAEGWQPVDSMVLAGLFKTALFSAVIGVLASRVVYRLGTAVSAARDMGAYHLEELLGEGGMGQVWRASHRLLQRSAAIKLIRPEALAADDDPSHSNTLKRFEKEARATARLTSIHTVQIFDFGRTDDGVFYYVMELLDGLDMDTLVQRCGPVLSERAIVLLKQVCHSLMDAHTHDLIHRDVKPSNIFVCRLGPDCDFVKVLDFGLVKEIHVGTKEHIMLTQDGLATGTPAFMAPEVALGAPKIGPRTDIYTFGCVAYWLLTGETLFDGITPLAIVSKHVSEMPVPPSQRSELAIPGPLEQLIMQCLEKDPVDRPQSMAEIAERLDEIEVETPWTPQRAKRWWERHRPTEG